MFWVPLAIVAAIVLFPILSALLLRFLCPRLWSRLMAVLSKSSEEKLLLSSFPSSNNSVRSTAGRHHSGGGCGGGGSFPNGYGYSSGGGDTMFEASSATKTAGRIANSMARGLRNLFSFGRTSSSDGGARRTLIGKGHSQESAPGDTLDQVGSRVHNRHVRLALAIQLIAPRKLHVALGSIAHIDLEYSS